MGGVEETLHKEVPLRFCKGTVSTSQRVPSSMEYIKNNESQVFYVSTLFMTLIKQRMAVLPQNTCNFFYQSVMVADIFGLLYDTLFQNTRSTPDGILEQKKV